MEIRRKPPNPKVRVENLEYAIPHEDSEAKNILEEIVWYKDIEINNFKKSLSLNDLINQIDNLPSTKGFINGLIKSKNILKKLEEIKIIEFDHNDVVRHPLVSKIIRAYQNQSTDDKD